MSGVFDDPQVASLITPEIQAFLETNMPGEGTSLDYQVWHWTGVTAAVLVSLNKAHQRIRELEADA